MPIASARPCEEPLVSATMTRANYYEILGLPRDETVVSADQVKKAYRRALLSHHPDKTPDPAAQARGSNGSHKLTVDEIALAYKTLSEPSLKAEYDRWLASNRPPDGSDSSNRIHHTGLETVDLDDLAFDEQSQAWTKSCRCGVGGYSMTEDELERNVDDRELIVGCRGCSLWLRVLFSVDE